MKTQVGGIKVRPGYYGIALLVIAILLLDVSEFAHGQNRVRSSSPQASSFDATNLHQSTELASPWLIHAGDDPAYARADFDDSQWLPFDARELLNGVISKARPEILWYRLHLRVNPTRTGLALLEHQISSAFEIYVNGQLVMKSGQVAPFVPYTLGARQIARIPDAMTATGTLVIALRVHISRTEWGSPGPGYAAENLTLGDEGALHEHLWLSIIGNNALLWALELFGLTLGIVALALFQAQRRQWEYLWIFLQFFCTFCLLPFSVYGAGHSYPSSWDICRQILTIAAFIFEVLMFLAFLRVRPGWRTRALFAVSTVGLALSAFGLSQGSLSVYGAIFAQLPLLLLTAGVLPFVLIVHLRRGNREAGILLIPIVLSSISIYVSLFLLAISTIPRFYDEAIRWNTQLVNIHAGPFVLSLQEIGILLYQLSLGIIMVLRSTRLGRQQALMEGELAAARAVQQVILPQQIESIPGFTIETAYEPAQQVGGDFFQIVPTKEGGLLLVLGDVAGKGLPAAMLVSVMVGAIRATAEYTLRPEDILTSLNERLVGRSGGSFSTALAAHVTAEGRVTIANAGHLFPYLDGQEIELPVALPLGILGGVAYPATEFELAPGSRLTFYSDGVIEAQTAKGELFGFARGQEISTQSASAIVDLAKQFGQSDDITVVAIQRDRNIAHAA